MKAEILSVGTELLLGDILNTNAQFLARELASLGIGVYYQTVVGDNAERLRAAYDSAFDRADMVVATGGLGPTEDDLTKETGAKFFGKELIFHEEIYAKMLAWFHKSKLTPTENNKKQAYFPEGSIILPNGNGNAPGCIIEEGGKILIMMPGPPNELIPMFENEVVPYLKTKVQGVFVSKTLRIFGIGESLLESRIKDLIDEQTNPTIAPYAKTSEVHLRLTARADNTQEAEALLKPLVSEIYGRLGQKIYGEDDASIEKVIVSLMEKSGLTIAVAESCTGGQLTSRLVDVPGASRVLLEGAVTYSNQAKIERLGVRQETLAGYGAVSRETAEEMAKGVALSSGADIGISTTGIAGPDGGSPEKPVGLVYVGFYYDGEVFAEEYRFSGNRQKIRERAVSSALDLLRNQILKNKGE